MKGLTAIGAKIEDSHGIFLTGEYGIENDDYKMGFH